MKFYTRKSPRHPKHDYTSQGAYFITICTKNRKHFFGEIYDGKMKLNKLGEYAHNIIKNVSSRKNTYLDEFIIMPNHIHAIITICLRNKKMNTGYIQSRTDGLVGHPNNIIAKSNNTLQGHATSASLRGKIIKYDDYTGPNLGQIINAFKGNITKYAKTNNIPFKRQSRYHDIIIKDKRAYNNISRYIINNPKERKEDRFHR